MKKLIGKNYLHTHPIQENTKGIDDEHCIVDKKELQEVQKFFEDNPELIQWIGNGKIHRDINTGRPFNIGDNSLSDLEKFIDCYKQFGIELKLNILESGNTEIILAPQWLSNDNEYVTGSPKFEGFGYFYSNVEFDQNGKFIKQGFWE